MKKVKIKIPAKINLCLDIVGSSDGFHELSTLVASIAIYDTVTVSKRQKGVSLATCGIDARCDEKDNNAFKAAKAYCEKFGGGAAVKVNKKIPVGAGLGGSSADVAGVLNGLKRLYGGKGDVTEIACALGSDCAYMLNGGFALLGGKGDVVTPVKFDGTLYLIVIVEEEGVSAGAAYKAYDDLNVKYPKTARKAAEALSAGDFDKASGLFKNDLYEAATRLQPKIKSNYELLLNYAPTFMSGSGSAVVGVFKNKRERDRVYKNIKKIKKVNVIKTKTL